MYKDSLLSNKNKTKSRIGSLLEPFKNQCISIFDFDEADSEKVGTDDLDKKYVFWNETKRFQRKMRLAANGSRIVFIFSLLANKNKDS